MSTAKSTPLAQMHFKSTTTVFGGLFTTITVFIVICFAPLIMRRFKKNFARLFHPRSTSESTDT